MAGGGAVNWLVRPPLQRPLKSDEPGLQLIVSYCRLLLSSCVCVAVSLALFAAFPALPLAIFAPRPSSLRHCPHAQWPGGMDARDPMAPIHHLARAKSRPEVQAVATQAGIDLSAFTSPVDFATFRGLFPPMQKLVSAGLDTDENLELLFGDAEAVRDVQADLRIPMLMGVPEGSPAHAIGLRGVDAVNPDAPASAVIMRLLPQWRREATAEEQAQECAVCQEALTATVQPLQGCRHVFHVSCITEWLSRKSTCPSCRKALPLVAPRPPTASELAKLAEVQGFQRMMADFM